MFSFSSVYKRPTVKNVFLFVCYTKQKEIKALVAKMTEINVSVNKINILKTCMKYFVCLNN